MPTSLDMPVFLVPYDESWPAQFAYEATQISSLFEPGAVDVIHIGSTAIPGIAAKPIIDIMVLIDSIQTATGFIHGLTKINYHYYPYGEDTFPERRWHCKPDQLNRTHHLHLVERGSRFELEHILFRDFLRKNSSAAQAYERLKHDLAERFPTDRESYTDGKSVFVKTILEKAKGH